MSFSKRGEGPDRLQCSFCRKSQEAAGKLIGSPSGRFRAYICDECIFVCNMIIEDDKRANEPDEDANALSRFVQHPLAPEFLDAAERWAIRDLRGSRLLRN